MADEEDKELPKDFYNRRSGFSIFDFWRRPGWQLGTGAETKTPYWYVVAAISFAVALWIEWADITGGASLTRIAAFFIIISGVVFYFLMRLQQTLFWGAIAAAGGAVLTLVMQLRHWLSGDGWPGWQLRDLPLFVDLVGTEASGGLAWLGNQSAILLLISVSILFLVLTLIVRRIQS